MDIIYLAEACIVGGGNPIKKFAVVFISTRLAKLILKKTLNGTWRITQIPSVPIRNTFGLIGYVPAFTSPVTNTVLFIKDFPGICKGCQMV